MPSSRTPLYTPFDKIEPEPDSGGGAASVVGVVVLVAMVFVAVAILRGVLAQFDAPPPEPEPPENNVSAPTVMNVTASLMRPRGDLLDKAEAVDSGLFSDTVVFTGRLRNHGAGGKLIVRARIEYPEGDKKAPVVGEQVFTTLNASSTEPYRIELKGDAVRREGVVFTHEVVVP